MQLQELPISNIDQVVLYDKFWGTFAILKIRDGFILQIQIRNYLPDALFVYKLERQPTLMFSFEISKDIGVIEPGDKHTFEIKYKPNYNLNQVTEKHSFCLTIIKMRSTELYNLSSINKPAAELLENHEGNQYDLTFLPRQTPSINQLTFHDFDFIQRPKIQKETNMKVKIYPTLLLQNTYQSLQIRFNYFKERKIQESYLNNIMSQVLYIKVALNYFSQMSLSDRIQVVNKIKYQLKTSEFCLNCLKPAENFEQHIQCCICGCFIGCCASCAESFLKMHFHECNKFVGYKLLQNLTQAEIENSFMEFREEENRVQGTQKTIVTGNQFLKERWMQECQKMLDESAEYIQKLRAAPELAGEDFGDQVGRPTRVISTATLVEEADKILQLYNYNREKQEYEIDVEIDRDVRATLENVQRCRDKETFLRAVDRCKQIYDANFNQLQFMAQQYAKYRDTYEAERAKVATRAAALQHHSLSKYAIIPEWNLNSQTTSAAHSDIQVHSTSNFPTTLNKKLNDFIEQENYEELNEEFEKLFDALQESKKKVTELETKAQQLDEDRTALKKEMGKAIGTYKDLTQELQQIYAQNAVLAKILDTCEDAVTDQETYKKLKAEDRLDELKALIDAKQLDTQPEGRPRHLKRSTEPQSTQNAAISESATRGPSMQRSNQTSEDFERKYESYTSNRNNYSYTNQSGVIAGENTKIISGSQTLESSLAENCSCNDASAKQLQLTGKSDFSHPQAPPGSRSSQYNVIDIRSQPISPQLMALQHQDMAPGSYAQPIRLSQLQLSPNMAIVEEIRNKELGFLQEQHLEPQSPTSQQKQAQLNSQQQTVPMEDLIQGKATSDPLQMQQVNNQQPPRRPRQYKLLNNSEVTFQSGDPDGIQTGKNTQNQSEKHKDAANQQQSAQNAQKPQSKYHNPPPQPTEQFQVQMEVESLYGILVRLQKYQAELEAIGGDLGRDMYFRLIELQANMFNVLMPMFSRLLNNAFRRHGIAAESVDFKKITFRAIELKFRPQVNSSLPHPFRIFLLQFLEIAAQYEHFYDEIERLCYYSIAKEPWALEEYKIALTTTPYIDEHCDPDVLYEMLRVVKEANIQL